MISLCCIDATTMVNIILDRVFYQMFSKRRN
jgi:hypothetical protein